MDSASSWQHADFQRQWEIADRQLRQLRRGKPPPVFASFIALMNGYVDPSRPLSMLDCACTTGYYLDVIRFALRHRITFTGSDLASAAIEIARARHPDVSWHVANLTQLPFANGEFDIVMASGVLEHVPDWRLALEEICRVAAGQIILHRLPISPTGRFSDGEVEMYGISTPRHSFAFHDIVEILLGRGFLLIGSLDTYASFEIPEQTVLFRRRELVGVAPTPGK
jgi:SAM-dependent methyltransferase